MPAKHPKIYNLTLSSADTEYSQALPEVGRISKLLIQCRTAFDVRLAFVTGKVAGPTAPYMTIKSGTAYYDNDVIMSGSTLFLASSEAGVVAEILVWD